MNCPFEFVLNEEPLDGKCRSCFWWLHKKNKCSVISTPDANNFSEAKVLEPKQFLERFGFQVGKVGYRNILISLEMLHARGEPGPNDVTNVFQIISQETGRTTAAIRQSVRTVIIWAWEKGMLKEAFPNWQKRPRLLDLYYFLQNQG